MGSLTPPAVRAHGLSFRYPGGREALQEVELSVEPGEVVALLGPNGSGKTSLLRLLATDLRPSGGTLELLGTPTRGAGPPLRRRIGYAPDQPVHLDALTGAENLRLFTRLAGADPGDAHLDLAGLLRTFALDGVADTPVGSWSFGMRRKLLLAQALASRPELLLLDEPAVGLDPAGTEALGILLRDRAGAGAAVVLATNEIREAPFWAHRIVFLHKGRVLADASPVRLLQDLQGRTMIQVTVAGGPPPAAALAELGELPGVTGLRVSPGVGVEAGARDAGARATRITAETLEAGRPLPHLLQLLVEAGAQVREVRIREPGLSDLFRTLTGEELDTTPSGDVP